MHKNIMDSSNQNSLTSEQKTGFVLLLVFGILAVGLGALQLRNNIYNPFAIKTSKSASSGVIDDQLRLQSIDTDQDGLSDYEEMTFYETSAYLPDTDSDGVLDKVEIESGEDPLCPRGEYCSVMSDIPFSSTTDPIISPLVEQGSTLEDIVGDVANPEVSDTQKLAKDPEQLRAMLLSTGELTEADLAGIDDATLLQMAEEIISQEQ